MKPCQKCYKYIDDNFTYCYQCQQRRLIRRCKCGKKITTEYKECFKCSSKTFKEKSKSFVSLSGIAPSKKN